MAAIKTAGYTVRIEAHNGENELVLVFSWGQDGKSPLVAVAAEVDGGARVVFDGDGQRFTRKQFRDEVQWAVDQWQAEWMNKDLPAMARVFRATRAEEVVY